MSSSNQDGVFLLRGKAYWIITSNKKQTIIETNQKTKTQNNVIIKLSHFLISINKNIQLFSYKNLAVEQDI